MNTNAFVSHLPVPRLAAPSCTRLKSTYQSRRPRSVAATVLAIEKGSRVRVKVDLEMYHIPNHRNEPFNVKGLEGVVSLDLPVKWTDVITATKQFQVKFTDPKFMAHFDDSEIELVE